MNLSTAFLKNWAEPWREYASEFIGVSLFVFLASSVVVSQSIFGEVNLLVTALGIGFSYTCVLYATSHVSGGFLNPAVVISLWLVKRLSGVRTVFYLVSQVIGSVAGSALVWFVFGERAWQASFGVPNPGLGVATENVLAVEIVFSAIMVFLVFAISVAKTAPNIFGPLVFGLFIFVATVVSLPVSGASLNLVRSVGPAIFAREYLNLTIYIVGSLAGGLAGFIYEYIFLNKSRK